MIDFWARLDETDVEKYAKTLILPEYMSHLNLRPFSLSEQRESASGREPLTLLYVGDGRLEELELRPERDALPLVASLDVGVDVEKIRLPNSGAYWTWSDYGPSHPFFSEPLDDEKNDEIDNEKDDATTNDKASRRCLRVYFEPRKTTFSRTATFDAQDAYVSVSRREIFFSWRVLEAYLEARCRDLLDDGAATSNNESPDARSQTIPQQDVDADEASGDATNDAASPTERPRRVDFAWDADFRPFVADYVEAQTVDAASSDADSDATVCDSPTCSRRFTPSRASKTTSQPPKFAFEVDDQNVRFRFGPIAGSLVAANGDTFEDAILFSGLRRSLSLLSDYVYYDPRNAAPTLDETGVRLRLTPVENDANDAPAEV
ncbi:MAG: hypothetical protein IJZ10_08815 [Thermoguttaceae bacterium]|nr:hypothetical protein [Thermoguttaceae bacterium]